MRVLITGAGGQVGRALTAAAPRNAQLVAYAHRDLDIGESDAVQSSVARVRPDIILNAAAYTAVDRAESERNLAHRINADGPRHLAEAARACGARLLHISTDFVFDGRACSPYRPEAPTNPLNIYGVTKREGEAAVLQTLPDRSVVLRTAWVYAATGNNFVRTMLQVMRAKGAARVVADQVGTPTCARSLAHVIWRICQQSTVTGVHHWTDAGVASWYDFAVAIAEEGTQLELLSPDVVVTPIASHEYPTPAQRPRYSVLDKSSLTELAGAAIHWRKQLRSILREVKDG